MGTLYGIIYSYNSLAGYNLGRQTTTDERRTRKTEKDTVKIL